MHLFRNLRPFMLGAFLALVNGTPASAQATTHTPLSVGQLVEVAFAPDSILAGCFSIQSITRSSDGASLGQVIPAGKVLVLREVSARIHTYPHGYSETLEVRLMRGQVQAGGIYGYGAFKSTLLSLPASSSDLYSPLTFDFPTGFACPQSHPPRVRVAGYVGTLDSGSGTFIHGWGYLVDASVFPKAAMAAGSPSAE